tara:strand:- start:167 stop:457 length:291 start_codon:yes stop_codon:yes gene_type:complete
MTHRLVNGELIELTSEEEIAFQKMNTDWKNGSVDRALIQLREERNDLLAKTDWSASSDLTMSDEMKTYRQQLRDATSGLDTVEKIEAYEFPTEVTK